VNKPPADVDVTVDLVRELLRAEHPDLAELSIQEAPSGWDNALFRLGEDLAVRLPRRAAAAALLEHEQHWLPVLQRRLPVQIPVPVRVGHPQRSYPWYWSVTPWIAGDTADRSPIRADQLEVLARFFEALHTPAPAEAPRNPYRGVPLGQRSATFERCAGALAERDRRLDVRLSTLWEEAVSCRIDAPATWIHGDLHVHNVLVTNGRIQGVIDWGDIAQGDRATDLAAVWILLSDRGARNELRARCANVSAETWCRARGWALLLSAVVLEAGDPALEAAAEQTLQRLLDGP
jgi:aminoglycoside phosphotransferase (APT) family kinase protein